MPVLLLLLGVAFSPSLHAQATVNLGGTGALGDFINPTSVTSSTGETCNYTLQIDLAQGKVFAIPFRKASNFSCNATPVDITAQAFGTPPSGPINDGVLEVNNFTLQFITTPSGASAASQILSFVPNVNNTPVIIRATGNVTINASTTLSVEGQNGGEVSATGGLLRGSGGVGGPGGYNGGAGGNGGITPSVGSQGHGPGGGPGGAVGVVAGSAKFLTTGVTLPSTTNNTVTVPTSGGGDIITQLRGGSGGGGGGGTLNGEAGRGGGGGGGAILIASNTTITVNGTLTARGGDVNLFTCPQRRTGSPGTGGVIRLLAATIAGSGTITAAAGTQYASGCAGGSLGSDNGLLRLEAFTISFSGTLAGATSATSSPGQLVMPGDTSASNPFLRFARVKDAGNASNCVSASASDAPCVAFNAQTSQTVSGRTGSVASVDAVLPNPGGASTTTVNIDFIVGPFPGFPASPTNPNVTLVVTPLDPGQGGAINYQAPISPLATDAVFCPSTACMVSMTGVTLPLGFSSMSAFVVLNLTGGGTLAHMFPNTYEGEAIESVRLETTGSDTKYVLIAKSGREFPYSPAR